MIMFRNTAALVYHHITLAELVSFHCPILPENYPGTPSGREFGSLYIPNIYFLHLIPPEELYFQSFYRLPLNQPSFKIGLASMGACLCLYLFHQPFKY